ncbi:MAG: TIGR02099 family protein [Gammaproteobacteria bacterium]|nr:TIGR02099 family protein [Gammaproteobacteria bacterium]HRX70050.1 YhdP family protein [Candidatus Competibacteraceae bacterium]
MRQLFRNTLLTPTSRTRWTLRWTRRLLLTLLLPLLLLAAFGQWWVLPRLNDYRDDLASALGDALHIPVRIEAVTATLDGWRLALGLRGVSLDDPGQDATLAHFKQAAITLNLWRSLREWQPIVGRIRLEGGILTLEQRPDGTPGLFNTRTHSDQDGSSLPDVVRWLFELPQLEIIGEQLTLQRSDGFTWQLLHPYLRLQETARGRRLAVTADLPANLGKQLELTVEQTPTREATAERNWRLQGKIHFEDQAGQAFTPTEFEAMQNGTGWQVVIQRLRAENALTWVMPWLNESARQWLTPLNPQGELPEITLRREPATGAYRVTAVLQGINVSSTHGLPGFDNIAGRLTLTPEQGRIELNCRTIQVDTAGLLRAPITLDTLSGTVDWRRSAEGLQVESAGLQLANADLNGQFWGSVTVPDTGKPLLDIQGHYHDVQVKQAWRYLPVAVIPPKGIAWLDRALIDGRVTTGDLVFRGPPAAFPFDQDEGLFETGFQVEDAVLDYAPGWPRLERLQAEARFRNRGLTVEARSGRLLDGEMQKTTTRIDDLSRVVVEVEGQVKGPGASMWRALRESPFGRELNEDLPDLQISGASTLDLELTLPTDGRPSQTRGRVELLDNDISLPAWKVELSRLHGEARFTESSLEARDIQALWRGEAIRLDLDLADREGRRELRTQVLGKLGLPALIGSSAAADLESQITGASDWKAALTVPTHRREQESAFSLELSSDLRGVAIDWPPPLGKTASESRPLRIAVQPTDRNRWGVALEYEPEVRAALELSSLLDTPQFERGELRIGAGAAQLPSESGLAIVAELPRWSWATPAKAPSSNPPENRSNTSVRPPSLAKGGRGGFRNNPCERLSAQESTPNALALVRSLDAQIDAFMVADQSFREMTIHARRSSRELQIELNSATLSGQATLPDQPTPARPINVALQRLQIQRATDGASSQGRRKSTINPCQLPPLALTVADLQMDDQHLGRLRLAAIPRPDGIQLSGIELHSEQQQIDADGAWWWNDGHQASRIKAALRSPALGESLAVFGYPESGIARGPTQAQLDAEWAAALPDFALDRISGTLNFEVGPGQLLEINPGLGRMIGLFSVQNLNRRLNLDFSDLFQPGTSFDRISGEFTFEQGQAHTDNLNIEAPAARIKIQGRVDLKNRDYDQQITVTPQLGGALPIAGAIVGGPVAGAAMFVAERLLQKGIEQATRYQYRLSGSWDDPVLEPLPIETPPSPSRQGFASDNETR